MNSPPEISVVIPVFNRAWSIARAVRSVLGQSFGDFELVIVDDASSDDLEGALQRFADARLRVLRHERNRGAAAARNTGIRASRGEAIAFLDSDDEWLPAKLERQRVLLAAAGESRSVALCGYALSRDQGTEAEARPLLEPEDWYLRLLLACNVSFGSCALVRRSAFEEFGTLDEAMPRLEDWDWLLRYAAKRPIASLSEPLAVVHAGAPWPSVAAVNASVAQIWERHRQAAGRHSQKAQRLLRSTIWYERGVAYYHHGRALEAAWCLGRSLLLYPARGLGLYDSLARRRGRALGHEARPPR
ncbi:MAG TPA: glycosyltransferase family 2 protein [Alphaproteobacteria bacterium]|nr:glycosyltransferase family 2 protein [Alphaproteobacteria bacterium]